MVDISPTPQSGDDSSALPNIPISPNPSSQEPPRDDTIDPLIVVQPSESEDSPGPNSHTIPIPKHLTNNSKVSYILSDVIDDTATMDTIAPDIASTDVFVASDGSFVETPSGPAARELKKYWDHRIGVGKSVRSPYAITAFVNQHGKQMFRVGRRELSAPAANAAEIEERITLSTSSPSEPPQSPRTKRRSRISMNAFPSMFKTGSISSGTRSQAVPPVQAPPPRKLRKTRSIPDMVGSTNDASSSQSTTGGRVHSRSVTGADVSPFSTVVRSPNTGDIFAEAMDWNFAQSEPSSSPTTFSTYSLSPAEQTFNETHDFKTTNVIMLPFGYGVIYDSPSRKSSAAEPLLPLPRHLREVQSFESGLTARQVDHPKRIGKESPLSTESYPDDPDVERPPSALRLLPPGLTPEHSNDMTPTSSTPEPIPNPEQEPALLSRYPTDIFDVLQTYRGLPLIEKLSLESEETTVIKLSLSADEGAAPRDDPRFVIWGEVQLDRDGDDQSVSHESVTDLSVHSTTSKRRPSKAKAIDPPSVRSSSGEVQKVLIAATIERWIAQLTSDLNYDELLDFFLTYRSYVNAVDLCHLLIARFHWALQHSSSPRDERVRRIVRVRTFVAIRYWLLTFFTVDFLPNRDLRLLVADWLNTLIRDPVLQKHNDSLGIVRKLIKVAKECKQAHAQSPPKPSKPRTSVSPKSSQAKKEHVLGEKFAAATRKSIVEDEDSDVDLDFMPNQDTPDDTSQYPRDIANAHLSTAHVGAGLPPARPSPIPYSSFSILQRTEHAPGPTPDTDLTFVQSSSALPVHHSVLSRAFVKTIGRLGRWRRVLNSRSSTTRTSISACADVSAFDLELSASRDLLTMNGGVEKYLKIAEPGSKKRELPTALPTPVLGLEPQDSLEHSKKESPPEEAVHVQVSLPPEPPAQDIPLQPSPKPIESEMPLPPVFPPPIIASPVTTPPTERSPTTSPPEPVNERLQRSLGTVQGDQRSFRSSSSTDSFGEPLTTAPTFAPLAQPQWSFDIDDLDLSDTSSDCNEPGPAAPPGLRRPARKLPLRRDFEFVRRDTVSSMGIISRDSVVSTKSSHASTASLVGLGGNVAQWQLNALVDSLSDEGETGDVEDALRRLEGQINPKKQQEKASKVDGWVRTIQERMAAGDYEDEQPNFSDDSDEEKPENLEHEQSFDHDSASIYQSQPTPSISEPEDPTDPLDGSVDMIHTPVPTQTTHTIPVPPGPSSPTRQSDAKPVPEDAVPIEILQSRVSSRPSTPSHRASLSRFVMSSETPRVHRSFILNHRATDLAEHFAMIDRELFMGVKFEELVLDDWMNCKEVDVLDWVQYLKDRARWKVEKRYSDKTGALGAVRARFNLMANFTISEIVLTQPHERPMLVSKFIRIAWKAYLMCNFSTLVAIITALRSDWVTTAMKRTGWSRVGMFENRMLKDLKLFTTTADDFKYIRQIVTSIVDVKPLEVGPHAASVISGGATDGQPGKGKLSAERPAVPSACIPFIGIYLSQLRSHSRLPDLIDPTAPGESVSINPITSNFDALAHPEVFSALAPLPPSIHLEPLINVHKQRRIAGVIKALVAGQQRASLVQFDVDKKLFQKCLRLRGLNADTLQKILSMYSE